MTTDPLGDAVKIGVAGNETDVVAEGFGQNSAGDGIGAECFEGTEYNGMMSKNKIVSPPGRLFDQLAGGVKGQEDTLDRLSGIPHQKTDIIPVFGQVFRGYVLQDFEKFLNGRHSFVLSKEKEAHP
jgi:hypothetical protein